MGHHGSGTAALLPEMLTEETVSGELLFGPLSDAPDGPTAPEAESWKVLSQPFKFYQNRDCPGRGKVV